MAEIIDTDGRKLDDLVYRGAEQDYASIEEPISTDWVTSFTHPEDSELHDNVCHPAEEAIVANEQDAVQAIPEPEIKTSPEAEIETFNQEWKAFLEKWGDKFAQTVIQKMAVVAAIGDKEVVLPNVSTDDETVWKPISSPPQLVWVLRKDAE